ncbi:MAG TPA: GNAT family N-acetyltransferase [Candidatus Baltobacteraceae bacterium]|nr:GNAT family N-acetyltransferase [Candidatus Baltobacteraceae bacterium]
MLAIRSAVPADAADVARVHVRSWQVGYRGLVPDDYLDGLHWEDRAARYTFFGEHAGLPSTIVAVEGDAICGFATTGPCRVADAPGYGELLALYVDPDAWGRGVGRALIARARSDLVQRGFTGAVLWLLAGNVRAERFYRSDGWLPDDAHRNEEIWGVRVDEVRFRRALA